MDDEKGFNFTLFVGLCGLTLMGGPFLLPLFSAEMLKTAGFKIWYIIASVVFVLLAFLVSSPPLRSKTENLLRILWNCFKRGVVFIFVFIFYKIPLFFLKVFLIISYNLYVLLSQKILSANCQGYRDITNLFSKIGTLDELSVTVNTYSTIIDDYERRLRALERRLRALEGGARRFEPMDACKMSLRNLEEVLKGLESPFENWDVAEAGTRRVLTYKGVEFSFRYCPSGTFTMGSPSSEPGRFNNERQRKVRISAGFWIFETPTTQAQWDAVGVGKSEGCEFKGGKLPVENVTWYESDAFIKKLNELCIAPSGWLFALPSEEQWEYACRAGTSGSDYGVPLTDAAWYDDNSGGHTYEVGTKEPNDWGIYDMLGNVWEWTNSKYNSGSSFVLRGGGWNVGARYCRPAKRCYRGPSCCYDFLGFRGVLVRSQSR